MSSRLWVALLFGGRSGEHEVSLRSAASVAGALRARHEVLPVLIDKAGGWLLQPGGEPRGQGGEPVFLAAQPGDSGRLRRFSDAGVAAQPDVYFPVLHGPYGEDGTIQGLLECLGIPFTGSGVQASALAMDKKYSKWIFRTHRLPTPAFASVPAGTRGSWEALRLVPPVVVKPVREGSTIGLSVVRSRAALAKALALAFRHDDEALVEAYIPGRDLTVGVLGDERIVGMIPARFASTRLPGKPLLDIHGKPMIQHVYERSKMASCLDRLVVATDTAIYWAKIDEPEAFDALAFDGVSNDGDVITGIFAEQETLLVTRENKTYAITGDLGDAYTVELIDANVGCTAHRTFVSAGGSVYWWSRHGIVRYNAGAVERVGLDTYGSPEDTVNADQIALASAIAHDDRSTIYFALPGTGQSRATFLLPYNYALGVLESEKWDPMDCASLGECEDSSGVMQPVLGGYAGQVFRLWDTNADGIATSTTSKDSINRKSVPHQCPGKDVHARIDHGKEEQQSNRR